MRRAAVARCAVRSPARATPTNLRQPRCCSAASAFSRVHSPSNSAARRCLTIYSATNLAALMDAYSKSPHCVAASQRATTADAAAARPKRDSRPKRDFVVLAYLALPRKCPSSEESAPQPASSEASASHPVPTASTRTMLSFPSCALLLLLAGRRRARARARVVGDAAAAAEFAKQTSSRGDCGEAERSRVLVFSRTHGLRARYWLPAACC
jgi:hypothetical protein